MIPGAQSAQQSVVSLEQEKFCPPISIKLVEVNEMESGKKTLRIVLSVVLVAATLVCGVYVYHYESKKPDEARIESAKKDKEHMKVDPTELGGDSARAVRIREYGKKLLEDPALSDVLDSKTQCYDPEMCINICYESDKKGWAHAMQVMPEGDACYVGFCTKNLPYALRWFCRTTDEDGVGIALPTTGTNRSTVYQKENGYYNTLIPGAHDSLRFDFGYLCKEKAQGMEHYIEDILKNED
jgi:hypothetical protein